MTSWVIKGGVSVAVLDNVLWRGEPIKAVIKFDKNTEYTVYTDLSLGNTDNFIKI